MHAALNTPLPSPILNISLLILSLFLILQACGRVDKSLGLGKYSQDQDDDFDSCQGTPTNTSQLHNNTTQEDSDSQPDTNTDNIQTLHHTDIPLNDDTNLID